MLSQPSHRERENTTEARRHQVRRWLKMVQRLPDVRMGKVIAVRDALRRNEYDDVGKLSVAIDRLQDEIDILCHRKSTTVTGAHSTG